MAEIQCFKRSYTNVTSVKLDISSPEDEVIYSIFTWMKNINDPCAFFDIIINNKILKIDLNGSTQLPTDSLEIDISKFILTKQKRIGQLCYATMLTILKLNPKFVTDNLNFYDELNNTKKKDIDYLKTKISMELGFIITSNGITINSDIQEIKDDIISAVGKVR